MCSSDLDETKKALNKVGFTEKMFESYNKGDKDFNAIVSRLKRDNIDLVYVGGYHQESGLILRQMRDQGLKTVLMAGDALADKEFASITGPAGEGTLFTFGPDPRNKPTAKAIVEKFKANNIDPEGYTLYTYAAMQVWSQAVAKVGSTDPKKVMEAIKAGAWDTVIGKLEFDAKGDKDFTAIVSRMKRDNIDLVYVGGYHQESGLIVRQMRDQGLQTVLMAGDALADKEFASITGPAAEGTLFTFGPDPRNKPTAKAIVEKFKAANIDPEGYTLYTYAAMQVWSQAVTKAGTTDPKKVMDTIKAGAWDTVIGKMEFDAKGDIKQIDYVVYKWDSKGNYTEINPKGS